MALKKNEMVENVFLKRESSEDKAGREVESKVLPHQEPDPVPIKDKAKTPTDFSGSRIGPSFQ